MQVIKSIEQGGEDWLNIRMGFVTASKFKDVQAKGAGKTRKTYMYQIAAEIITGEREEGFSSKSIEHGTYTEPTARAMYELDNGVDVEQIAFAHFDDIKIGCSPDGLVGDRGLVEIKCPNTTTQIETFLSGKMPTSHMAQVQGQMWVMDRDWCDFVSFDPRINGAASYFCTRIEKNEDYCKDLARECSMFLAELEEIIKKLT